MAVVNDTCAAINALVSLDSNNRMTVQGSFDGTGAYASGTWEMDTSGTISSGTWATH